MNDVVHAADGPDVAVVIPCFNDGAHVGSAIKSVRQQSFKNWECVIVDDGSSDGSLSLIEEATSGDDRFRVVAHSANQGLSSARNSGIRSSSAGLIAFLDSDDLMLRRSLEDRLRAVQASNGADVAGSYGGVRYESIERDLESFPSSYRTGPTAFIDFVTADGECPFPVHAPLTKRPVLLDAGAFREDMTTGAEDWDLWQRILRQGYRYVPAQTTSLVYRFRPESMTRAGTHAHVTQSVRLIEEAHRTSDVLRIAGSPEPLTEPLDSYRLQIAIAKRGIRFAALAALGGRDMEVRQIIEELPIANWALVGRHIRVEELINSATKRASIVQQSTWNDSLELLRVLVDREIAGSS
jgi:GT2 family glycosyltransferase